MVQVNTRLNLPCIAKVYQPKFCTELTRSIINWWSHPDTWSLFCCESPCTMSLWSEGHIMNYRSSLTTRFTRRVILLNRVNTTDFGIASHTKSLILQFAYPYSNFKYLVKADTWWYHRECQHRWWWWIIIALHDSYKGGHFLAPKWCYPDIVLTDIYNVN